MSNYSNIFSSRIHNVKIIMHTLKVFKQLLAHLKSFLFSIKTVSNLFQNSTSFDITKTSKNWF